MAYKFFGTCENGECNYNYYADIPTIGTIICTAFEGYVFDRVTMIALDGSMDYPVYYPTTSPDMFTVNNTVFTLNYDLTGSPLLGIENFEAFCIEPVIPEPDPTPIDILEFTNIFNPSHQQMILLNEQVYYSPSGTVDLREYIYNLYTIPYDVESLVSGTDEIQLGLNKTSIISNKLSSSSLKVVLGKIIVPLKYNNVYDYLNVDCFINLPNIRKIQLDSHVVVNQTITCEYIIDLYTMTGTVNIMSSFSNNIVYSDVFKVGDVIPLKQLKPEDTHTQIERQIKNNIVTPFIEVVRYVPDVTENLFGKTSNKFDTLVNNIGYIEVSKIVLNVLCTDNEKKEIENLLQQGIIIK